MFGLGDAPAAFASSDVPNYSAGWDDLAVWLCDKKHTVCILNVSLRISLSRMTQHFHRDQARWCSDSVSLSRAEPLQLSATSELHALPISCIDDGIRLLRKSFFTAQACVKCVWEFVLKFYLGFKGREVALPFPSVLQVTVKVSDETKVAQELVFFF